MNSSIHALAVLAVALAAGPVAAQQQPSVAPAVYVDPNPYQNWSAQPQPQSVSYANPYQLAAQGEEGQPLPPPPAPEQPSYIEQAESGSCCGSSCGSSCGSLCEPVCNRCCRTNGLIVGAEIGFLKPHHSNGAGLSGLFAAGGLPGLGGIETEADAAFRGWLGWQLSNGVGARVRYWDFDHNYGTTLFNGPAQLFPPFGPTVTSVQHDWDVSSLDAEIFRSLYFDCGLDMTFSAGARYVDYSESVGAFNGNALQFGRSVGITGIGLSSGIEVRQRLLFNIGGFSHLRGSVIMGDETNRSFDQGFAFNENQIDDVKFIYEAQAGLEYISPVYCGGYWFVRGGAEVQYWDGFGVDNVGFIQNNASVGFGGLFFSVGMQR